MKLKNTLLASALLSATALSANAATELTPEQAAALKPLTIRSLWVAITLLAMPSPPHQKPPIKTALPRFTLLTSPIRATAATSA